MHAVQVLAFET